jgi:RNA polymerase sigma-70 factor (ECF subfamily)
VELLQRARAARSRWPDDFDLPVEEFRNMLEASERADAMRPEADADLYLARACARGNRAAIATFDRVFLSQVPQFIARMCPSSTIIEEVQQQLREKLLVGRAPKISEYGGHGPLGAWIRVAALRAAIDLRRGRGELNSLALTVEHLKDAEAQPVELAFLKAEYQPVVAHAFVEAIARLSSKQRNLLRLQLIEELTLEQMGSLFGVHASTVFRWLTAAREMLVEHARQNLRERMGVSAEEFDSLVQLVGSHLDLSLSRVLRASATR